MLEVSQFLATFCTAIFAGAALYINLVEHPARRSLDTSAAVIEWARSYKRATFMQAPLAVIGFIAGTVVWLLSTGFGWLVAAAHRGGRSVYIDRHHADESQALGCEPGCRVSRKARPA